LIQCFGVIGGDEERPSDLQKTHSAYSSDSREDVCLQKTL